MRVSLHTMLGKILLVVLVLPACPAPPAREHPDDGGTPDAGPQGPTLGEPIDSPANAWAWIDFPDSSCDDGTTTGIGVNKGSSDDLLVFFNGGGACWDYNTCFVFNTADHGPFGATQLAGITTGGFPGTIMDRNDAANPFKDWSFVFVPYCTGDIHSGDVVQTYDATGSPTRTFAHVGHKNVLAYLERLGATFPTAPKIAVTGSSAGGGGAVVNYPDFRRYWPDATMYLIDDSLPFFESGVIEDALLLEQAHAWDSQVLLDGICGGSCGDDLSKLHAGLAASFPHDRMALLSSEQDQVISQFDQISGPRFEEALTALQTDVLVPSTTWQTFTHAGSSHTMLADVAAHTTSGGTNVESWIALMVNDARDWASTGP